MSGLPSLFPTIPDTVTSEIMAKLQSFLQNPTIEKGSVYHQNIFHETIQITKGQSRYVQCYIYMYMCIYIYIYIHNTLCTLRKGHPTSLLSILLM